MALKRLPNDVQSLLCASVQVNSYKRAIEELIHNSLDAKSTSIAIRIHIQEGTIQVIDNGYGITQHNFDVIGQRYMTSKVTDVATLKAAPKNYGYRGEFLANIITVSQMVKVTSRHESTEETWAKTFTNGKENKFAQMTTRPTKGTTVSICTWWQGYRRANNSIDLPATLYVWTYPHKGFMFYDCAINSQVDIKDFLFNQSIQKRGIDSINELQNIKSFLEQLSLIHNNISLSLRDDSQNEIIFKIHKKRDIYQTFSTLFRVDRADVIELQVEKQEYKVKGYIGKTNNELNMHWIFLNGKYIHNCSKLHKVVNEYLKKSLHIKDQKTLKSKKNNDEHRLFNQNIPFYFIFVTCPYIDYDVSHTPKQSDLEFKNWEQINRLFEKLVKFYAGDDHLIEMKKVGDKRLNNERINTKVHQDTRDQVKKIMDKILGSNSKKLGVSQLQNGVKGKMVKRKVKKKTNRSDIIPKLFLQNDKDNNDGNASLKKTQLELNLEHNIEQHIIQQTVEDLDKKKEHNTLVNPRNHKQRIKIRGSKKCKTKEIPMHKNKKELNANMLPTKKKYKTEMKQKHILNKHKKVKVNHDEIKNEGGTDSVCKRSKIVAQKVEHFLHYTKKRNVNAIQTKNAYRKGNQNTMFLQKNYCAISDKIPQPPKINKYVIEKYIMNKLKAKSYKTTYDLVQTVLKSQQERLNALYAVENNTSEELYRKFHRQGDTLRCITKAPRQNTWTNKYICSEYSNNDGKQEQVSQYITDFAAQYKISSEFNEYVSLDGQKEMCDDMMTNVSERLRFIDKENDIFSQNQNSYCALKETSYRTLSGPLRVLTYDSHQYHKSEVFLRNDPENCYTMNRRQNVRFITKESRDNFVTSYDLTNRFIKPFKTVSNKQTKPFDIRMKQTIDESYTIEYSKSNENNNNNIAHNYILPNKADFILDNDYYKHDTVTYEPVSPNNYLNPVLGNTYTIHPLNSSFDETVTLENQTKRRRNSQSTGLLETYSVHDSYSEGNHDNNGSKTTKNDFAHSSKNFNIVFVSKSQHSETAPSDNNTMVEPLNVCETVFYEIGSDEKEFAVSFNENNQLNDSLYGNIKNGINEHVENEHVNGNDDINESVSHHFSCAVKAKQSHLIDNFIDNNLEDPMERKENEISNRVIRPGDLSNEGNIDAEHNGCNFEINFNIKNRPRFVPKGLSQIFENCRTKTACDYDMDTDYFEDSIYNNFANVVQVNSEIYEPLIQNVEDLTTKNIHNFQNKVKKDNASLVFDETSLKDAKVLGQADCKFIVAIMKKRCDQSKESSEYLILFDQHAVHERIRLEKNLADYLNEERWTSIAVDNIILKMSKDEILYLHNYKDKFTQLGLQWTILNDNEVTVHSIPEAILGKNPREVEKVIKAVRNLMVEEINVIKLQKGCVSLYPKSILDLVFSESCRYAIKFGDRLSKGDCVELLNALSNCKTPFQCAHGRPVMAVIMDIIADKRDYKINMEALRRFRQISTRKTLK